MSRARVLIMGAAGRDFHNFNMYFRGRQEYEVVGFTATQIPNIEGRVYPASLAGPLYPRGIPIHPESELVALIHKHRVDQVIFAYSDVSHEFVMHRASEVLAAGADFRLMGAESTQLQSNKPVISICAVRTGSGKSQTTRRVAMILRDMGLQVAAVRHPMPYGNLAAQAVQRFGSYKDLAAHHCTIEEREEYEPHLALGVIVYAGVDYERILRAAEAEVDVVLWDGGNNDFPFFKSGLEIVVVDPLRAGHERSYHPGEMNLVSADVVVINKVDTADAEAVLKVRRSIAAVNSKATVIEAASPITVERPEQVRGKRVLAIEDGPTVTHGEMGYGAAWVAAQRFGAAEVIDPRPFARGSIAGVFERYPTIGNVLPAMGYGTKQMRELQETVNRSNAELVLIGTPIDLVRLMKFNKPAQRVSYDLQEIGKPTLDEVIRRHFGGS